MVEKLGEFTSGMYRRSSIYLKKIDKNTFMNTPEFFLLTIKHHDWLIAFKKYYKSQFLTLEILFNILKNILIFVVDESCKLLAKTRQKVKISG